MIKKVLNHGKVKHNKDLSDDGRQDHNLEMTNNFAYIVTVVGFIKQIQAPKSYLK